MIVSHQKALKQFEKLSIEASHVHEPGELRQAPVTIDHIPTNPLRVATSKESHDRGLDISTNIFSVNCVEGPSGGKEMPQPNVHVMSRLDPTNFVEYMQELGILVNRVEQARSALTVETLSAVPITSFTRPQAGQKSCAEAAGYAPGLSGIGRNTPNLDRSSKVDVFRTEGSQCDDAAEDLSQLTGTQCWIFQSPGPERIRHTAGRLLI